MPEGVKIKWYGHSCFRFEIAGLVLFFDPVGKNQLLGTTLNPEQEKQVDAIFISHGHWDHNDSKTALALRRPGTRIYCPREVVDSMYHEMTFRARNLNELESQKEYVVCLKAGDDVDIRDIRVECIGASEGVSYLIAFGRKILFMGDSLVTSEMIEKEPDLTLFPLWAIRSPDANLNDFLTLVRKDLCIPMHYHTNTKGLPNFYMDEKSLRGLLPKDTNMRIMNKNRTIEIKL